MTTSKEIYSKNIQQIYHAMNSLSKTYQKTLHSIFYDVIDYQQRLRQMDKPSTQTDVNFFLNLTERAKEYSEKESVKK